MPLPASPIPYLLPLQGKKSTDMPVIQQEGRLRSVKGLPRRWGVKAYRELRQAEGDGQRYAALSAMLDDLTDAPLPLDTSDAQIVVTAGQWAAECYRQADATSDKESIRRRCNWLIAKRGLIPPQVEKFAPYFARVTDPAWWTKQLRRYCGRKFEHAAIRLGFVSKFAGAYASDETVKRRQEQVKRNHKILQSTKLQNELEQEFTLAELAANGNANKAIRRGELMLRMRGIEDIAIECGDAGIFVTLTCPSKFHSIQWGSGTTNPSYEGATPRDAQAYLMRVWARVRAKLHRNGCRPYGFRIAEPHHDGCPHWHMLLFVEPGKKSLLESVIREHALAEDGDEPGAQKQRVKFVEIDASKGTAAGYIAKYVSKNIDGEHIDEHIQEDGLSVGTDLAGDEVIQASQRVEAWASTWGIRQFQGVGSPPVTVWRELRRVTQERIQKAPEDIRRAWTAAQKIEGTKQADFAEYIRAQGGVNQGRAYRIGVALKQTEIEGRYGLEEGNKPVGIYAKRIPHAIYESVRYRWKKSGRIAEPAFPWTRVNNCTVPHWVNEAEQGESPEGIDDCDWYESAEFRSLCLEPEEIDRAIDQAQREAIAKREKTQWTKPVRGTRTPSKGKSSDVFGTF